MPAVTCPVCRTPALLPDPWPHPGFTCAKCGTAVAIAAPPVAAAVPVAAPFELDDAPTRPVHVHHRNRTRGTDAFGKAFGEEMGKGIAHAILGLIGLAIGLAVLVTVWAVVSHRTGAKFWPF